MAEKIDENKKIGMYTFPVIYSFEEGKVDSVLLRGIDKTAMEYLESGLGLLDSPQLKDVISNFRRDRPNLISLDSLIDDYKYSIKDKEVILVPNRFDSNGYETKYDVRVVRKRK